jgi:hypothetical protein
MPTAGEVMDRSAALLNDQAKTVFTYPVQFAYLNAALNELQEILELNNVPVTNSVSAVIPIPVGVTGIGGVSQPSLPVGLIDIQALRERQTSTNDRFIDMTRVEFLPDIPITSQLIYWTWQEQLVKFLGATTNLDVQIEYIKSLYTTITSAATNIPTINSFSFLAYRTAALCAEFIGENKTRSDDLNVMAQLAMDRVLGISSKGRQSIFTRRRPFMAAYKRRGVWF